ncbi:MAG: adenylosuccinate synthetase [Anaerolineales bacterium]
MRGFIVVDLGFGDSGKGLVTDFLVRRTGAALVVRYNGGAQAGHNVVTPDGIHHTFSQFGSGTLVPGVRTFLSRHVVIHPTALLVERDALAAKGIRDAFQRLRISNRALVITHYHQAANRLREIARGPDRHGSCGIGFGETMQDALDFPDDAVRAGDLSDPGVLRRKLDGIRKRKREELAVLCGDRRDEPAFQTELGLFDNPDFTERWIASVAQLAQAGLIESDSNLAQWMGNSPAVIFEGAQGVLLDEDYGFHPYTTWSRCTAANAEELVAENFPALRPHKVGVLRSYAVRHGPGPLPTETGGLASAVSDHNTAGEWQGNVRYGWFDAVLARYALEAAGGVEHLAVTHMDVPPRLGKWRACGEYETRRDGDFFPQDIFGSGKSLTRLPLLSGSLLAQRTRLTRALFHAGPKIETYEADEKAVLEKIESHLGLPVDLISCGPRAEDVTVFEGFAGKE